MNKPRDDKNADRILDRVLGPDGPELTCEECFEQLDRFVELERAGANAEAAVPGMSAHLEGCPACDEDYASLREFLGNRP